MSAEPPKKIRDLKSSEVTRTNSERASSTAAKVLAQKIGQATLADMPWVVKATEKVTNNDSIGKPPNKDGWIKITHKVPKS